MEDINSRTEILL